MRKQKRSLRWRKKLVFPEWKPYHVKLRDKLFVILGGVQCRCKSKNCWHVGRCKAKNRRCVQIDHKNDDGYKEKHLHRASSFLVFYTKHPKIAKKKLQVLCANCNWAKRYKDY